MLRRLSGGKTDSAQGRSRGGGRGYGGYGRNRGAGGGSKRESSYNDNSYGNRDLSAPQGTYEADSGGVSGGSSETRIARELKGKSISKAKQEDDEDNASDSETRQTRKNAAIDKENASTMAACFKKAFEGEGTSKAKKQQRKRRSEEKTGAAALKKARSKDRPSKA